MKTKTTLAADIEIAEAKAKYDAEVKKLLADKEILARILKNCIEEFKDVDVQEIIRKYIEGEPQVGEVGVMPDETNVPPKIQGTGLEDVTVTEGTIRFDVFFRAIVPHSETRIGMVINLEAQNDFYPGYPIIRRGIFYCSRMISSQYGTVFTKSHYEKLQKVYSIWICANPPKYRQNTITQYSWEEKHLVGSVSEPKEHYDMMTVLMVCLGNPDETKPESILRLLDVLLSSEMEAQGKCMILEEEFTISMTENRERQVMDMCNLSKGIEEKGIEKGMEKGIEKGVLSAIRNLMETMKLSAEQAMDALKVPEGEKSKYASKL